MKSGKRMIATADFVAYNIDRNKNLIFSKYKLTGNQCEILAYLSHNKGKSIYQKDIEKEFNNFIEDIQEYDAVVNQTLLPMIQTKLENPKEKLIKEIEKIAKDNNTSFNNVIISMIEQCLEKK